MSLTPGQYNALAVWEKAKLTASVAVEQEREARQAVLHQFYPTQAFTPVEGTFNYTLEAGFLLKLSQTVRYSVDKDKLPLVHKMLAEAGSAGEYASANCFRYKPELAVTAYKNTMPSLQKIIDECVTSKMAAPSLELVKSTAKK